MRKKLQMDGSTPKVLFLEINLFKLATLVFSVCGEAASCWRQSLDKTYITL
jgi:hypothetical protein